MVDLEKMSAKDAAEWIHAEAKKLRIVGFPLSPDITVDLMAEGIQFLRDMTVFRTKPRVVKTRNWLHQVIESESREGFYVVYDIYLTDKKTHTFFSGYDRKSADKVKVQPGIVMLNSDRTKCTSATIYGILPSVVDYEIAVFFYQAAATNLEKVQAEINSWSVQEEAAGMLDRFVEKSKGSEKDKNHTSKKLAKVLTQTPDLLNIEPAEMLRLIYMLSKYEAQLFTLSTYVKSNPHDQVHWTEEIVKQAQALASVAIVEKA